MAKQISRAAVLLLVGAGIVLAVIYRHTLDPVAIRNLVASSPLSPLLFIALQIVASLLFIPRTVLGIASGLLFGLVWGSVWAIVGAEAGAAAGFAIVRWMGAAGTLDTAPSIGKLVARAEEGGWRAVAIVRLTPLPHSVANTALALTNLSWRDYLIGSFFGMLPMTIVQVAAGASGGAVFEGGVRWVVASLVLAIGIALTFLLKRAAATRT